MGYLIGMIFSGLLVLVFSTNDPTVVGSSEARVLVMPFAFLFAMFFWGYLKSRRAKRDTKLKVEAITQKMQSLGALSIMGAKHMAGLPLGQGAECDLYLCPDKVIFEKDANTFNLFFNKVLDVTVKTDVEIQRESGTSIGGAIAGGALFGPLGAMVGGMKEKEKRIVHKYLIYTYQNNDRVDYISFDVTWVNPKVLNPYIEHYKSLRTEQRVVEL